MNKQVLRVVLLLIIVCCVAAGIWWYQRDRHGAVSDLVLHGNVDIRQVELAFNASGRIAEVLAREGDSVRKGQLLAALDTVRLERAVAEAEARAAAQRQVVARYEAGSRPEEISKARADAEAARVDAENAKVFYDRQESLVAQHFISRQQLDNARASLDAAQARLKSARESQRLVELGPRKEDTAAARATLQQNLATLAVAQRDLEEGRLYAPADGVIQNRVLEPGDMASPQKSVFTLALTDPLWVRAYVPEPALGRLRSGDRALVTTDSYPQTRYDAWIGFISPSAEFTPKSVETEEVRTSLVYQIRVFVCEPRGQLRLGMPATVTIPLDQPPAAPGTPAAKPCPAKS
jgi:HlyD family secretion protein